MNLRTLVRIRRGYVLAAVLFWIVATGFLLNQWFAFRAEFINRAPAPSDAEAALAAARETWVSFFMLALVYAAGSVAVLVVSWLARGLRRTGAATAGASRAVWS